MDESQERVPMIDALRGLSCLGILLYHVRVDLWIGWWRITSYPEEYSSFAKTVAWLSIPTPFLGYAILLFFLISGFCIIIPIRSKAESQMETIFPATLLADLPPYLAALALTAGISYFCHVLGMTPLGILSELYEPRPFLKTTPLTMDNFLATLSFGPFRWRLNFTYFIPWLSAYFPDFARAFLHYWP